MRDRRDCDRLRLSFYELQFPQNEISTVVGCMSQRKKKATGLAAYIKGVMTSKTK